ncbi:MAG: hypothetical protein J6X30_05290, partial [Clostridia bacterium]|nr:hypothetical protein [Clostridia bacterium]
PRFRIAALDLHVFGTPPAFVLTQDQTLLFKSGLIVYFFFSLSLLELTLWFKTFVLILSFFSSLCTFQGASRRPQRSPSLKVSLLIIPNFFRSVNCFLCFFEKKFVISPYRAARQKIAPFFRRTTVIFPRIFLFSLEKRRIPQYNNRCRNSGAITHSSMQTAHNKEKRKRSRVCAGSLPLPKACCPSHRPVPCR